MDYIEAFFAVYGSVEKLPDLMYKFEHTHQNWSLGVGGAFTL